MRIRTVLPDFSSESLTAITAPASILTAPRGASTVRNTVTISKKNGVAHHTGHRGVALVLVFELDNIRDGYDLVYFHVMIHGNLQTACLQQVPLGAKKEVPQEGKQANNFIKQKSRHVKIL